MNIRNVTITGPATGFSLLRDPKTQAQTPCCTGSSSTVRRRFGDQRDCRSHISVPELRVRFLPDGQGYPGRRTRGTVTITNTVVKDYQKSGFEPRRSMIMNVSDSTAGPPHPLEGLISQNGVSYVGAAGGPWRTTRSIGSGNAQPGVGGNGAGTAVLLSGAHDVTVDQQHADQPRRARPGTDIGISVSAGSSTGNVISFNTVNRRGPDVPDTSGIGIDVFTPDGSNATLICNTFSQWTTNVIGAEQIACTPLPNGCTSQAYSAPAPAVDSGRNYTPTLPSSMPRRSPGRLIRGRSRRGCRCRREGRSPEPPPQRGLTTSL